MTRSDLLRRLAPARASTREGNGLLALQMHIDTNHPRQEDQAPLRSGKEVQRKRIFGTLSWGHNPAWSYLDDLCRALKQLEAEQPTHQLWEDLEGGDLSAR